MTKEQKLIEKLKELYKCLYSDIFSLISNKCKIKLKTLESEIASLEAENKQEPGGLTAEDLLRPYIVGAIGVPVINLSDAIKVMEVYAKSKEINLRDELIRFAEFWNKIFSLHIEEWNIDEYLTTKR